MPDRRVDSAGRVVRASPASIYRALVDGDARGAWLAPKGMTVRIERFEPGAGGGYRMVLTYEDPGAARGKSSERSGVVDGRFVELVPNERVVESVRFESEDPAFVGAMRMTWTLTAVKDGTEVRVEATDVPEGITQEDHQAGMESSLENLAEYVE